MAGIVAYSAYIPRLRLPRSAIAEAWDQATLPGEIAVANYDEDAFTMAVEAAQACLDAAPHSPPEALYFASTSAPYREKQMAAFAATACDLPRTSRTADFAGSARAGLAALFAASAAVDTGSVRCALVAAADARLAEPESEAEGLLGDGAAAFLVGREGCIAELADAACVAEEFTYFWRTDESRFVRAFPGKFSQTYGYARDMGEVIRQLLDRNRLQPAAIAKLALHSPELRAAVDVAKALGFDPKGQLVQSPASEVGCTGTADALLRFAEALDQASPDQWIVVAAYGEGAEALLFRTTQALAAYRPPRRVQDWVRARAQLGSYAKYLKYRKVLPREETGEAITNILEFKELKQDVRLYGSRCRSCGTVQYPLAHVCIQCKAREQLEDVKLQRRGTVFTFTVDHLIANLEHPLPMAVVDLEGGGRLYLQVTDFLDHEVQVGAPMVLTYRRLHEGGNNYNYFWKARPPR